MTNPVVSLCIQPQDDSCPFENNVLLEVHPGQCVWLRGPSGSGKTSLLRALSGLGELKGAQVDIRWDSSLPERQRVGVLFQQGVLIDALSARENIALSASACGDQHPKNMADSQLKRFGLSELDGDKMPQELSGGMLRRAALAQITAQNKRLIILDEPFVGLDPKSAQEIVSALQQILQNGVGLLLISHEEQWARQLTQPSSDVFLQPRRKTPIKRKTPLFFRGSFSYRLLQRIADYLIYSTPLILFAFLAAGFAISTVFAQMLQETDVNSLLGQIDTTRLSFIEKIIERKIASVANRYFPLIRAKIYVQILSQSLVSHIAPLLCALLLAGRIGGSYAGEVATMQASYQNQLLKTLGISPRRFTLLPATIAALIAFPVLTAIGALVSLYTASIVALRLKIYTSSSDFWREAYSALFQKNDFWHFAPVICLYRSILFFALIMGLSEICSRFSPFLSTRSVPKVITWAIVLASLAVILADWGLVEILFNTNDSVKK